MISEKKKKCTLQDIADEVGVSKATVSYVLNSRPGARVSKETRNRILHVANLYSYSPNLMAKALSSNDLSNPIGLLIGTRENDAWALSQEREALERALIARLDKIGHNVVLFAPASAPRFPAEALIGMDLTSEEIMSLSQQVFIPLLLLDSFTSDTLFYQFHIDYSQIFEEAARMFGEGGFSCVFSPYRNCEMRERICADIPRGDVYFCARPDELRDYVRGRNELGKSVVFFSSAAALIARDLLTAGKYAVATCACAAKMFPGATVFQYAETKVADNIVRLLVDLVSRQKDRLPGEHVQKIPIETVCIS